MNLFFDEESRKIIVRAKNEMYDLKHPYVGSEHLMLAILGNADLNVTKILNKYGITYDVFRNRLIEIVGIGTKSNNWFLFTPLLKKIINNAIYYSKDNNISVSPSSLLICLLQEGDGVANRILIGLNIDLDSLCDNFVIYDNKHFFNRKMLIDDFAVNMNKMALSNCYDEIIGRDEEIDKIIQILLRKSKTNPLLIGEAGVGKTAVVEELARRISVGSVPSKLRDSIIYNLPICNIVSDTKYRGEFESRLKKIISELVESKNIILFIDEVHTIVGAGGAEGAIDASNILKPYLARGDLKIIGATTISEYSKYILNDKALSRRFQNVFIVEPDYDKTLKILLNIKNSYEKFHNVIISDEIVKLCIDYSNDYIFTGKQPDKSIDLLDELCTYSVLKDSKTNDFVKYNKTLFEIENNKNKEIINRNFKKALYYRNIENKVKSKYNISVLNGLNEKCIIDEKNIFDVVYNKTKIPVGDYYKKVFSDISKKLKKMVYSQDNVIDLFYNYILNNYYISKKSPLSFLFVGESGVGKTFFADKLSELFFDSDSYIKINMMDFKEDYLLNKLIDNTSENQSIFCKVKQRPFSLIVFDNIDSSSLSVKTRILNILNYGYLDLSNGEKINLTKCIIILIMRSGKSSIGFNSTVVNFSNEFSSISAKKIIFNKIEKKDIINYIKKKYSSFNYNNLELEKIISSSNYLIDGFKSIDEIVDKRIYCVN